MNTRTKEALSEFLQQLIIDRMISSELSEKIEQLQYALSIDETITETGVKQGE